MGLPGGSGGRHPRCRRTGSGSDSSDDFQSKCRVCSGPFSFRGSHGRDRKREPAVWRFGPEDRVSNLSAFSMWDLFRGEVESQMRIFTDGLLAIESGGASKEQLAAIMRAAHSIKGAARIVHLETAVQ